MLIFVFYIVNNVKRGPKICFIGDCRRIAVYVNRGRQIFDRRRNFENGRLPYIFPIGRKERKDEKEFLVEDVGHGGCYRYPVFGLGLSCLCRR